MACAPETKRFLRDQVAHDDAVEPAQRHAGPGDDERVADGLAAPR